MYEIFFYLYKNYPAPTDCPSPQDLAHRLAAAGFEEDEINDAFFWLQCMNDAIGQTTDLHPERPANQVPMRIYTEHEYAYLGPQAIGFIMFLEAAGILQPGVREILIECAFDESLTEPIELAQFKILALIVLWSQDAQINQSVIYEELVAQDSERLLH